MIMFYSNAKSLMAQDGITLKVIKHFQSRNLNTLKRLQIQQMRKKKSEKKPSSTKVTSLPSDGMVFRFLPQFEFLAL